MKLIPRESVCFGAVALAGAMSGCGNAPGEKFASTEEPVTSVQVSKGLDPGPRAGAAGAGGPFAGLSAGEQQVFSDALGRFQEVQSVSGTIAGEDSGGLGPTFNRHNCPTGPGPPAT